MNYKLIIGKILIKLKLDTLMIKALKKLGYLIKYEGHDSNGIDLNRDVEKDINIKSIEVVFDVGASIGSMTNIFLDGFKNSKIFCFEPYQKSYNALENRFKENERVVCYSMAFSDYTGYEEMFLKEDSGFNSLNPFVNRKELSDNGNKQLVEVTTIDKFCEVNSIDKIDFLKIDTEGLEINVLKGCENMLLTGRVKYIFAECTFIRSYKQNTYFEDLKEFLQEYNYSVRAIYDQSNFGEKTYLTCVNVLFLKQ